MWWFGACFLYLSDANSIFEQLSEGRLDTPLDGAQQDSSFAYRTLTAMPAARSESQWESECKLAGINRIDRAASSSGFHVWLPLAIVCWASKVVLLRQCLHDQRTHDFPRAFPLLAYNAPRSASSPCHSLWSTTVKPMSPSMAVFSHGYSLSSIVPYPTHGTKPTTLPITSLPLTSML